MGISREIELGEFYNKAFEEHCRTILGQSNEKVLDGQFEELMVQFGDYLKNTPPDKRDFSVFVLKMGENGEVLIFRNDKNASLPCIHDVYLALQNGEDISSFKRALLYHSNNKYGQPPSKLRDLAME